MTETHPYRESEARFLADVSASTTTTGVEIPAHAMTVLHDDGLYRHLRFRKPTHSMYWFDLITWPGCLVIQGDMGSYTFARLTDMFEFFGGNHGYINPGYWGEKLQNNGNFMEYSEERFKQTVTEHVEGATAGWPFRPRKRLLDYLNADVFDDFDGRTQWEDGAREILREFNFVDVSTDGRFALDFTEAWDWDFKDYRYHYLWCCHAIKWGVEQYRAAAKAAA